MYQEDTTITKNIFIICSVRDAEESEVAEVEAYVAELEAQGHTVYYPARDTNQQDTGINICAANKRGMSCCDEVHIFYRKDSQGSHYDMGMARTLGLPIVVARNESYGPKKSFPRMLQEWHEESMVKPYLELIGQLVSDPQAGVRRTPGGKFYCRFCSNEARAVAADPFRIRHDGKCLLLECKRLVAKGL